MSNVKMWIALNEDNETVSIEEAEINKDYKCINCGGVVRARAKDSELISQHFYHVESCECNGESAIHKYWKENLVNIGESILIPTIGLIKCIDKRVEYEFKLESEDIYRPDLVIKTDDVDYKYIIVEIYNTNKKRYDEYVWKWRDLGYCVVEIDVNKLSRDKSNLEKSITVLYDKKKERFYNECKIKLKDMYSSLSIFKSVNINKAFTSYYGRKTYEESIEKAERLLSRVYKIIKSGCYNKSKVNLDLINSSIKKEKWDYTVDKSIIKPLLEMVNVLHTYN